MEDETPPVAPARGDDGRFNQKVVIDGEQEGAPRPPVADGETPIAVPLARGRDGWFVRMVIAAAALPPPPPGSPSSGLATSHWGAFCWMEGTGTGERIDLPELRQIAMAQLLVVGHIKIRASNATILNTSEYVLAWLVGSKGMHFERPDILGKSRRAVAALNKTFVTELIAATREAFFPGTTCVLAAEMFWREMRSAVEETGSGATSQLVPNGHKVVRTSDLNWIQNAHAALAEGLKAESEALVDLDQVTIAFKRQWQAGYGCSHAHLMSEMMALCPSIKLAELLALANLTSLYSMLNCLLTVSLCP